MMKTSNNTPRALESQLKDDGILTDLVGDIGVKVIVDNQTYVMLFIVVFAAMYGSLLLAKATKFGG